jgi:hypothetical protein
MRVQIAARVGAGVYKEKKRRSDERRFCMTMRGVRDYGVDDVDGRAGEELRAVVHGDVHQALAAFLGRPADVRGDDAVLGLEQGVIAADGLGRYHVQTRRVDLAAVEGVRKVLLDDERSAAVVEQDDAVLHLGDGVLLIMPSVWGSAGSARDDADWASWVSSERIRDGLCSLIEVVVVGDDTHAQGLCDAAVPGRCARSR